MVSPRQLGLSRGTHNRKSRSNRVYGRRALDAPIRASCSLTEGGRDHRARAIPRSPSIADLATWLNRAELLPAVNKESEAEWGDIRPQ